MRVRIVVAILCALTLPGLPVATAQVEALAKLVGACSELDPAHCLLPFPNDEFTTEDASTPTRLRVDLSPLAMPQNVAGKPIDPTEWNRNDGWSPGSMLLTFVPGLDLQRTWGVGHPQLTEPSLSLSRNAPIVILDTRTGERHPFWAELDEHPQTTDAERLLIIRPLRNFRHGHRYVVGLRDLRDGAGNRIAAQPEFARRRNAFVRGGSDGILQPLVRAGVDVSELYLAWDFTIASAPNLAGRALAIRDDAFAQLGDTDLADGFVRGRSPAFSVDEIEEIEDADDATKRIVRGTITVPNYLTLPQDRPPEPPEEVTDQLPDFPVTPTQMVPGSRFLYEDAPFASPTSKPVQNPVTPTLEAEFSCALPRTATAAEPARPVIYGHGLLGSQSEALGSSTGLMRQDNFAPCAVDWIGMSEADIANALTVLADLSNFPSLADRSQQGFLNFTFLGRAMIHPRGFVTHTAFQDAQGRPILDTSDLFYDGNSQGAIMGGALTALSPDVTRAVLGVPGMNYSTLLHRSLDWEGSFIDEADVGYATVLYTFYPDKQDQLVAMALAQMLWDRAETNGYAEHLTNAPLPNTRAHQVLLHVAMGDYQVAPVSAEVEARTIGARFLQTALPQGRHWADTTGERLFEHRPFDESESGALLPHEGSALVYWDSGNPIPPSRNVPPPDHDKDPHEDPRRDPHAQEQKRNFYLTGAVIDVHDGRPYCTHRFPRHEELAYDCSVKVSAD